MAYKTVGVKGMAKRAAKKAIGKSVRKKKK